MSQEMMDNYEVDVYLFDRKVFFDLSEIRPHIRTHYLKPFCGFGSLSNFICFTLRLNRIRFRRFL
jgi:hypothetical protein